MSHGHHGGGGFGGGGHHHHSGGGFGGGHHHHHHGGFEHHHHHHGGFEHRMERRLERDLEWGLFARSFWGWGRPYGGWGPRPRYYRGGCAPVVGLLCVLLSLLFFIHFWWLIIPICILALVGVALFANATRSRSNTPYQQYNQPYQQYNQPYQQSNQPYQQYNQPYQGQQPYYPPSGGYPPSPHP